MVTDNFNYSCRYGIIDVELLAEIGEDICGKNNLFFNADSSKGYLLVSNATVRASGNAYINSYNSIEHKISGKSILRYNHLNKVVLAEDIREVKKI